MKIVINDCFGGFGLSYKGWMKYAELKGISLYAYTGGLGNEPYEQYVGDGETPLFVSYTTELLKDGQDINEIYFSTYELSRDDPLLIKVVEALGDEADGMCADLKIVEIPDGTNWEISEYDGSEHIAEKHKTWG
jgi:hypothetical protein